MQQCRESSLHESSLGAVDWNLGKNIGEEFMIKSNINDWLVCLPKIGSIVTKNEGSISCQNIKNVACTFCSDVSPNRINWGTVGPRLYFSSGFYLSMETHDPCGTSS